jgi:hypothetical protein
VFRKGGWFLYLRLYGTDQGMNGRTDGRMEGWKYEWIRGIICGA